MNADFSFNPCFNGFFSSMLCGISLHSQRHFVSILVLMDSSLQSSYNRTSRWTGFVSILVLMDSSLQFAWTLASRYPAQPVSILVLMDSSLQSSSIVMVLFPAWCFNPCFNGFFSSIFGVWIGWCIRKCGFNPCFNGFFSSMASEKDIGRKKESFNPCFNGFFSSINIDDVCGWPHNEFQSLF